MKPSQRAADVVQEFVHECGCGKTWRIELRHWERGRCKCGRTFWALQPHAGGPLQLFPWPGRTAIEPAPGTSTQDEWDNATPAERSTNLV